VSAHLKYLSYVVRHKWFVLRAGLRTKAPLWRLLIHDWSKFQPCEWGPYVRKFYGSAPSLNPVYFGGDGWREWNQAQWANQIESEFDRAWLHHQHANPHHWQHWMLREDSGAVKLLSMPEKFAREMVADWMGAGRAITGKWEAAEWYARNRGVIQLHPATRTFVERLLEAAA
jgi:hypothetical protein